MKDVMEGSSNLASEFERILPQILDDQHYCWERPGPRSDICHQQTNKAELHYQLCVQRRTRLMFLCLLHHIVYLAKAIATVGEAMENPRLLRSCKQLRNRKRIPLWVACSISSRTLFDDLWTQDFGPGIFANAHDIIIMGGNFVSHSLKLHNFSIITCFA